MCHTMGTGASTRQYLPDKSWNKFETVGKVSILKNYFVSEPFVRQVRSFALRHRSKFLKYSEISLAPPVNTTSRLELEQRSCFIEFQEMVVPSIEKFIAQDLKTPSEEDMRVLGEGVRFLWGEQKKTDRNDPALDKVMEVCMQCSEYEAFAQMMVQLCNVPYYEIGGQLRIEEDAFHEFKRGGGRHGVNGRNSFTNVVQTVAKYLVAFLNVGGGVTYFGVEDDGKVTGVPLSKEDRDKLRQLVAKEVLENVMPRLPIRAAAQIEPVDRQAMKKGPDGVTRPLFVIEVVARPWCHDRGHGAKHKPYTYRGKYWAKVESMTTEMKPPVIAQWRQPGSRMRMHTRHEDDNGTDSLPVFAMNLVPVIQTGVSTSTPPPPSAVSDNTASARTFVSTVGRRHARSVFVQNLSWHVTSADLHNKFSTVGTVVDAEVKASGNGSKIFGIVRFATSEEAGSAIETLDGLDFEGRRMQVREDRGRKKTHKVQKCRDFQNGTCRYGVNCRFSHEITSHQQHTQKRNKRCDKKNPSFAFQKGKCHPGDSSWHSHDTSVCHGKGGGKRRGRRRNKRRELCRDFQRGDCYRGGDCRYSHNL